MYPISPPPPRTVTRHGFTLVELAIVVIVLAIVATLAATRFSGFLASARDTAAEADMAAIRDALCGAGTAPSLVGDLDGIPGFSPAYLRLANLLCPTNLVGAADRWLDDDSRRGHDAGFASAVGAINPSAVYAEFSVFTNRDEAANRGWRGPYLRRFRAAAFPRPDDRRSPTDPTFEDRGFFRTSTPEFPYGLAGEPAVEDPWGNPYVLQVPPAEAFEDSVSEPERFRYARIVSAGPDGILSTPCFDTASAADRRDSRLAGRRDSDAAPRGDDIVLFLSRADLYED